MGTSHTIRTYWLGRHESLVLHEVRVRPLSHEQHMSSRSVQQFPVGAASSGAAESL